MSDKELKLNEYWKEMFPKGIVLKELHTDYIFKFAEWVKRETLKEVMEIIDKWAKNLYDYDGESIKDCEFIIEIKKELEAQK